MCGGYAVSAPTENGAVSGTVKSTIMNNDSIKLRELSSECVLSLSLSVIRQ